MPDEVGLSTEGFPTFTTRVGLQSSVDSLMNHEVGAMTEGFPTLPAPIGFLSSVDSLVHCEVGTLTEGFPTLSAYILSLLSHDSLICCRHTALTIIFFRFLVTDSSVCFVVLNSLMFEVSCFSPHFLMLRAFQWPLSSFSFQGAFENLNSLSTPLWDSLESTM